MRKLLFSLPSMIVWFVLLVFFADWFVWFTPFTKAVMLVAVYTVFWIRHYWWESWHDVTTRDIMNCYPEAATPELQDKAYQLRRLWHQLDQNEKVESLAVHVVMVFVLMQDLVFTVLFVVWSISMRWFLHEFLGQFNGGSSFSHIGSANWLDDDVIRKYHLEKAFPYVVVGCVALTYVLIVWYTHYRF